MTDVKRAIAIACLTTLSLAALVLAPTAQAASTPTAETGPNTPFPEGKVRLLGYVGPEGSKVTSCKFVYGPAENDYTSEAPCANHPGDEVQSVQIAAVGGQFKLSFEGAETSDLPYNADPPEVQAALEALPAIGAGGVSVNRPVTLSDYSLYLVAFQGPLADTDVPRLEAKSGTQELKVDSSLGQTLAYAAVVETTIGGGLAEPHEVAARLEGLTPGATYHYRLLATNAQGTSESPDAVFRAASEPPAEQCPNQGAPGVGFLPECRAWEMVSPPAKNGGDVTTAPPLTRIAADGSAASFASPSPFGDASGAGLRSTYESVRTPNGWQTHGIMAPQPPTTLNALEEGIEPYYQGDFSADLDKGVFLAWRPLDESDPNVEGVTNLYLRDDLRSPGAGHYRLLTACPLCAQSSPPRPLRGLTLVPHFVAASADFKHLLFESNLNLVAAANSPAPKLYESEEGTLRLAGILPNNSGATESNAPTPYVGHEHQNYPHAISADGSKVFFTAASNLYMRLDHTTTVKLNESELKEPEAPKGAGFGDATPDGSKVFFTSGERLSEDAPPGGGVYAYDTTKPASDPHNLTFLASGSAMLGAGADGRTVYFVSGQPVSVQAWHDGSVRLIDPSPSPGGSQVGLDLSPNTLFGPKGYRVSAAGQLLFESAHQTPGLTGQFPGHCGQGLGCLQFYLYDPASEALQCVSCGPPAQFSEAAIWAATGAGLVPTQHINAPLSADGRHVFFSTDAALVPEDTNGVTDAYSFDTETSQVSLLSRGTSPYPSYFLEADPSGADALFTTNQPLSRWDTDSNIDLYDARVEGGLPEPLPKIEPPKGESALLPPVPPPARRPNGSGHLEGPGNPKQKHHRKHRRKHRHHRHGGHK